MHLVSASCRSAAGGTGEPARRAGGSRTDHTGQLGGSYRARHLRSTAGSRQTDLGWEQQGLTLEHIELAGDAADCVAALHNVRVAHGCSGREAWVCDATVNTAHTNRPSKEQQFSWGGVRMRGRCAAAAASPAAPAQPPVAACQQLLVRWRAGPLGCSLSTGKRLCRAAAPPGATNWCRASCSWVAEPVRTQPRWSGISSLSAMQ